jgi:hypothetical protein
MKTITYTVDAVVIDGFPVMVDERPANFEWFVRWILDSDSRFNNDAQSLKAAMAIERALATAATEPSSDNTRKIAIDDAYYDKLKQAAETPSSGTYPLRRGRLCLPWIEMIENAK